MQQHDRVLLCFRLSQGVLQSGGSGGEAGRPDRVPERAQRSVEQEVAQPHRPALTAVGPLPPPFYEAATTSANYFKLWTLDIVELVFFFF